MNKLKIVLTTISVLKSIEYKENAEEIMIFINILKNKWKKYWISITKIRNYIFINMKMKNEAWLSNFIMQKKNVK